MEGIIRIERGMTLEGFKKFVSLNSVSGVGIQFMDSCALSWAGWEATMILQHPLKSCTYIPLPQSFLSASIISFLFPKSLARWPAYLTLSSRDKFIPQAFSLTT